MMITHEKQVSRAKEQRDGAARSAHVSNLVCVCFQGKKDVCQIFNNILRRQIGTRSPTVEYFCSHQEVLFILLKGWVTHTAHTAHSVMAANQAPQILSVCLKVWDTPGSVELRDHAEGVHPPRAARQDSSPLGSFQQLLQLRGDVHLRHRLRRLRHLQGTVRVCARRLFSHPRDYRKSVCHNTCAVGQGSDWCRHVCGVSITN